MANSAFSNLKMVQDFQSRSNNPLKSSGLILDGGNYIIDDKFGSNTRDHRGHMQDGGYSSKLQGKLPWHPTFSDESPYASEKMPGGTWFNGRGLVADRFTPSQQMVQDGRTRGLADYFRRVEKGNELVAPVPYDAKSAFSR